MSVNQLSRGIEYAFALALKALCGGVIAGLRSGIHIIGLAEFRQSVTAGGRLDGLRRVRLWGQIGHERPALLQMAEFNGI